MARLILILLLAWPVAAAAQSDGRVEMQQRLQQNQNQQQFRSLERNINADRTQLQIDNRMQQLRTNQRLNNPVYTPPSVLRR